MKASISVSVKFQSTYLYKVRRIEIAEHGRNQRFNPRTYIRYDGGTNSSVFSLLMFQSTYLYKVRLKHSNYAIIPNEVSIHVPI